MDALRNMFQSLWQRYHSAKRRNQIIIGVVAVFAVMIACSGLVSAMQDGTSPAAEELQATQQPTAAATATEVPALPTSTPVPSTPTPEPTATPAPTATPTPEPTATLVPPTPTPQPTATLVPPTPRPATPTPRPTTVPTVPPRTGVNGNPWGFDFNVGTKIYDPPAEFCTYFSCITSFWDGDGYVVQCVNGDFSQSGGNRGACSRQGGVWRTLYSH